MTLLEAKDVKEFASTFFSDPILKMAVNAAVDAAPGFELVRCKDCKHYDNSEGIFWCHLNSKFFPGGMDWHGFPEDGFCSYGERRSDE